MKWRKTCNINVPPVFANQLKSWQNFQWHVEIQLLCDALLRNERVALEELILLQYFPFPS